MTDEEREAHFNAIHFSQREPTETLRDRMATAALTGILSNPDISGRIPAVAIKRNIDNDKATAICAYEYADAMLRAREAK